MKPLVLALCAALAIASLNAHQTAWQPSPGHTQMAIWPGTIPDAQPVPGPEMTKIDSDFLVAGRHVTGVFNVSQPTMTVYAPEAKSNTGVAVVVFPGGGFQGLAMDLEGTEVCEWLTSEGITCVLLKYRVPSVPYDWHCRCRPDGLAISTLALEDAQRAMGLVRFHASQWHIDPQKVGVLGFSAGGYMVAEISTHFKQRLYTAVDAADRESCRPNFAVAIYPGHLWATDKIALNPNIHPTRDIPPTFLLQAEDDHVDNVNDSLAYYMALKDAGVPVEMHLYAQGGHAFGLRSSKPAITGWPHLVETWLATIGMISP